MIRPQCGHVTRSRIRVSESGGLALGLDAAAGFALAFSGCIVRVFPLMFPALRCVHAVIFLVFFVFECAAYICFQYADRIY